ncbi:unnamed protein product [Schistosoma curassoni]|uniref:Uncharacterized protein n=1 Tax=Schistosoma curassoni TaxID=6186 RepID=A0A183JRV4_9TREM|nr:unnamed protein product [Schistosoma curassoni]
MRTNGCRRKGKDCQGKDSIPKVEEHMQPRTTVNQYQNEDLQHERQDSSNVRMELKLEELPQLLSNVYRYF